MQSKLSPYLNFDGNTREAMEFYQSVFGGKLDITTFKDGGVSTDPAEADKIMHAALTADNGIAFFAADMPQSMERTLGDTISLSVSGSNEAELRGYWEKLSDGATIKMPLAKASWGDTFGMLTDKFGMPWMIDITA